MRSLFFALAAVALGCSSASNGETAGDSAVDSIASDSAPDARSDAPIDTAPIYTACGSPPYFTYHARVDEMLITDATRPLEGATISFDACPGVSVTTNATGEAFASIGRGMAFTATFTASKHVTVNGPESIVATDEAIGELKYGAILVTDDATGSIPDYDPTKPAFAIVIEPDAVSPDCNVPIGVTLQLEDQPDAHTYYTKDWPSDPSEALEGSSVSPVVFFTGVGGTEAHALMATSLSSKCAASDVGPPLHQTGTYRLSPGVWTVGNVALHAR